MRRIKRLLVRSEIGWQILASTFLLLRRISGLSRISHRFLYEKCIQSKEYINHLINDISPTHTVISGPFQGMVYSTLQSAGSMLAPKILGTYEAELALLFKKERLNSYEIVVDVGCAEGYYAVGIALSTDKPHIVAYDTSDTARKMCQELALKNQVEQRIDIRSTCTSEELKELRNMRGLVISDCEGYEMELFTKDSVSFLANSDLIIEVHEHEGADLQLLMKTFEKTHDLEIIQSRTDFEKVAEYKVPEIASLSFARRAILLAECRPCRMSWLVAVAKSQIEHDG